MQDPETLRSLFRASLATEAANHDWGMNDRLRWITKHLDEYIERWLGFAALPISPRALIQSDLFTMVEIAVDALEEEVAQTAGARGALPLGEIRAAVEALRKEEDKRHAVAIKELVEVLSSQLVGNQSHA
jgi:hypothetical protein